MFGDDLNNFEEEFDKNFDETVPAHGVIMLRLSGGSKISKV